MKFIVQFVLFEIFSQHCSRIKISN